MTDFLANKNERWQVTFGVAGPATLYPGLAAAAWRLQLRPTEGSATLLLDSSTGVVTYAPGTAPAQATVTFQWPQSALAGVPTGRIYYDFGFILPGADFEIAGSGTVVVSAGVTQAGVAGSPAAPTGSDDTWRLQGAAALAANPSLASTVSATASSAAAALASQTAAASSQTAAASSATAAASSATAASSSATAAASSAAAAAADAGLVTSSAFVNTHVLTSTSNAVYIRDLELSIIAKWDDAGYHVKNIVDLSSVAFSDVTLNERTGEFPLVLKHTNGDIVFAVSQDGAVLATSFTASVNGGLNDYTAAEIAERSARAVALMATWRMQIDSVSYAPWTTYTHNFVYGQSLAKGTKGSPAKTTTAYDGVLMVGQAVRPGGAQASVPAVPAADSNLHPAVAVDQDGDADTGVILSPSTVAGRGAAAVDGPGEEVGIAALQFARRLFYQRLGVTTDPRKWVVSNVAVGSRNVAQLSKGASPNLFQRLSDMATAGRTAALGLGGTYGVGAMFWLGGESDYLAGGTTDKASYKTALKKVYTDFVSDVAVGIAGQSDPPVMITYQTSGEWPNDTYDLSVSEAQRELAEENTSWYLAAPSYPVTNASDGHLDANGYRWLSQYFGRVFYETVILRRKWRPLSPLQATYRNATVLVDFWVPAPPIQFQPFYVQSTATTVPNKGFTVIDANGTASIISVSIVGDASVQIVCVRALVGPVNVYYGRQTGTLGGGNLCDSDALVSPFNYSYVGGSGDPSVANVAALVGAPYPLENWCVLFKQTATAN